MSVRKITGVAILLAIEIIFQTVGNLVQLGPVSLNLSLIPIAVCAIMYGPIAGAFLGLVNGIMVLFAPTTQALFFAYAPLGTVIVCLFKCTIAGLVSGLIFRLIKNKNTIIAVVIASLIVPIINTGLFALGCFTIMAPSIAEMNADGIKTTRFVFLALIGFNFIFEFGVTTVLSPICSKLVNYFGGNE